MLLLVDNAVCMIAEASVTRTWLDRFVVDLGLVLEARVEVV